VEYLIRLDRGPYRGKVKGDATAAAMRAVELANLRGQADVKYPPCGAGRQVIVTVRAGFNFDFVHQQILDEASVLPGVYDEVRVSVSA